MDENLVAKIKTMTPEQKANMASVIQAELASRQAGGITDTMTTPTRPRGFLPTATNTLENMPNALSIAIRGKPIKEDNMTDTINTLLATEAIKNKFESQDPYKQSQIELNKAKLENIRGGGGRVTGQDEEGNPVYSPKLSPAIEKLRIKDTQDILSTVRSNEVARNNIAMAEQSLKNIPQGLGGKIKLNYLKNFEPNNPILTDWQNVKMVLTDAQLLNTAKTKGAISDREMDLFATAAANDDLGSISRIKPIFTKLINFMNAEERAKREAYARNYGEELNTGSNQGSNIPTFATPEDAEASGYKGEVIIGGRRARID